MDQTEKQEKGETIEEGGMSTERERKREKKNRVIKSSQLVLRQVEVSPLSHPEVTIDLDHYHLMATMSMVLKSSPCVSVSEKARHSLIYSQETLSILGALFLVLIMVAMFC